MNKILELLSMVFVGLLLGILVLAALSGDGRRSAIPSSVNARVLKCIQQTGTDTKGNLVLKCKNDGTLPQQTTITAPGDDSATIPVDTTPKTSDNKTSMVGPVPAENLGRMPYIPSKNWKVGYPMMKLAIAGLAGAALVWFMFYGPSKANLEKANAALKAANLPTIGT
jgi:hypothetical protein